MIPTVTVPEVAEDAHLLDVREDDEWEAGHAPGAQHLPMGQLPARLAEVPASAKSAASGPAPEPADSAASRSAGPRAGPGQAGRDVVVVCRSGVRSARVVQFLLDNGWEKVYNLDGGMQAWAAAGRPLVTDSGAPAAVI